MSLFDARHARGWSQDQLAKLSGVAQRNISKIERGDITDPRVSTVEALERALGVARGTLRFGLPDVVASA